MLGDLLVRIILFLLFPGALVVAVGAIVALLAKRGRLGLSLLGAAVAMVVIYAVVLLIGLGNLG